MDEDEELMLEEEDDTDPFVRFDEWLSPVDEAAYAELTPRT